LINVYTAIGGAMQMFHVEHLTACFLKWLVGIFATCI